MLPMEIESVVSRIKPFKEVLRAFKAGQREFADLIITGDPPDFSNANLKGIKLINCTIINAIFRNSDLTDADMSGSDLSNSIFTFAILKRTKLSDATLYNSLLKGAVFDNTNLQNANLVNALYDEGLKKADTTGAITEALEGKRINAEEIRKEYNDGRRDFTGVIATNQTFSDMKLPGIIFKKANLSSSWFDGADLAGANLEGTDMTNCSFKYTNFKGVNCTMANFFWSLFQGCNFDGAKFKRANLTWCRIKSIDLAAADITDADFSWSLTEGAGLSEQQILSFSPEMLETIKMDSISGGERETAYGRFSGDFINIEGVKTYGALDTRPQSSTYGSVLIKGGSLTYADQKNYSKRNGVYS